MMRAKTVGIIVLALALQGCATTKSEISRSSGGYSSSLKLSQQAQDVINSAPNLKLPDNSPSDAVLIYLALRKSASKVELDRATALALIHNSDMICEHYMADFMLKSRTTSSTLQITSLGFSSLASVTEPAKSANILAGLSAFATGAEEKLKKTVQADKAPELLYKAVMAERSRERNRLLTLLQSEALGDSAPAMVIGQIADYHSRCGPTVGINALGNAVDSTSQAAPAEGKDAAEKFVQGLH